ncbi:MAG TPA: ATP-binding protein, partial [Cyclobacteriaceae bacterium]|nr:ATP-binding protein [Cyclobacteriaceae bacterium]
EVGKETLISYSKERFNTIKNQSNILSTVFDRIEPFGGRKRGRPSRISLEKVIKDAFSILNGKIIEVGSNVILPEGDTYVTVDEAEIQQVIINLLDNSLYWLRLVPKDTRQILVKTKRKNPDEVEIIFSDSGPGVDPKFGDRIFEPYFSSKPDGMGLGLMIAGEIISDYYDGSLELLPEGPLSGATFRITLCRRV